MGLGVLCLVNVVYLLTYVCMHNESHDSELLLLHLLLKKGSMDTMDVPESRLSPFPRYESLNEGADSSWFEHGCHDLRSLQYSILRELSSDLKRKFFFSEASGTWFENMSLAERQKPEVCTL